MSKIYVASSWRNLFQPEVVKQLRKAGHEVYDFKNPPSKSGFNWSQIDLTWREWSTKEYIDALKHPIAQAGFDSDFNAMKESDICVLVLPSGRSAHSEAGWMKGAGKKVFVYSPIVQDAELMYKMFDGIYDNIYDIIKKI